MNEMTLPSGHRVRNSSSGAKHFVSLKLKDQSGVRTRDLRLLKQAALTTVPGPLPYFFLLWNEHALTVGNLSTFHRGIIINICMCKTSLYRAIFSVRAIQFMMRYPMFSVGHFEIKNNHVGYQLKNI